MHGRKTMSGVALTVLLGGAALLAMLFLYLTQSSLIYFPNIPSRALMATPQAIGLAYEPVTLHTEDGVALDGWYLPGPPGAAPATLLFFHGNAGNISHRLDSLRIFHGLGLAVLIIDYRGYGRSEGTPSEAGTYRDAEAAWRYLTEQRAIPAGQIVVFGRSLGAAIAAQLASRRRPGALILESAFTSVPDMAAELYPFLPARYLARLRYDTAAYLDAVDCPVLIVHSRSDDIIPFAHGQRLFERAREPKRFLQIEGGHNDGFLVSGQAYRDGLADFLRTYLERDER